MLLFSCFLGSRKKKSRSKSKKLRHRDDLDSSSSDDESSSSSLNSLSSSEGEYRSKRDRSRSRSGVKGSKKRKRRRYSSEDSSDDSLPVKKRKRSKKSKKIKKKKKKSSKRDGYVSSASSDSGSCSTCKDEDISSDELGSRERSRGRSREKRKGHRDSTKGRIGNRKNRSEARRSISPSSSYGSERTENTTMENNPVRLRSVITVANVENEEDDNMKNEELKEETVYDYDDYPSSKSNDSVELDGRFNYSPDKESVAKEVNSGSILDDNKGKESNVSDDLESILRQKALENLSRFRGGTKTKPVAPVDDKPKSDQTDVKQLTTRETVSMTPVSQPVPHRNRFTWRRDPSAATGKDEKASTYSEPHSSGSQPAELKLPTSRVDNKILNETSMVDTDNVDQKSTAVVETPSSAPKQEGSSKERQNESNDNSQFEKKTMSVMRGGEMVQVSYKVYIPNKAPALARRQLKR
ncbi:hypothetical protein HanHA300_Chr11g0391051 [Helianthus annuus]|nr:hypothetical protein HanHA300_Chr11g0391051 [Helianthus annuus]KAJ0688397.1 hypothetical protein HanOQP8_Chr11g0393881 [Helianthus annuus]